MYSTIGTQMTEPQKPKRRKASDIYKKQNTILHKAMLRAGLPYEANKDVWLKLATDLSGRTVAGLSEMTLFERHKLINHFQQRGYRIFAPSVPDLVRGWKKGDPDVEYEFRPDGDPQVRMVVAMWVEMGYAVKTLRGLCWKLYKKDDPRWLTAGELGQLVNIVKGKAEKKNVGHYYRQAN